MIRKTMTVLMVAGVLAAAVSPAFAQHETGAETKAEVPALFEFHEVIYPLWHEAWPNKDAAMMRELLPQVKEHVAAIDYAELPGILRDKQAKWDGGVAELKQIVERYDRAATANDGPALFQAVEDLHSAYEGLVRIVRPVMKELDAYHQVLYRLYHHDWPGSKLDAIRADTAELVKACEGLAVAAIPRRFVSCEGNLKPAFATLCAVTSELATASQGDDLGVIGSAVEKVHSAYQATEKKFE